MYFPTETETPNSEEMIPRNHALSVRICAKAAGAKGCLSSQGVGASSPFLPLPLRRKNAGSDQGSACTAPVLSPSGVGCPSIDAPLPSPPLSLESHQEDLLPRELADVLVTLLQGK